MKLFIPELGTRLWLSQPWTFLLHAEYRNLEMFLSRLNPSFIAEARATERKTKEIYNRAFELVRNDPITKEKAGERFYRIFYERSTHYPAMKRALIAYNKACKYREIRNYKDITYTLPKETILEVDRIYIRQGAAKFSSVTFKIRGKRVLRFWAKLEDVNRIDCEIAGEPAQSRKKSISRNSI